jgi:hypothetical protein
VNAIIEHVSQERFSMWFAYIHCWATDMFSMDLCKWYRTELNQNENVNENENENGESPRQSRKKVRLKIDCDLL